MTLKRPPLWEMSIAMQTSDLGGLKAQQALNLREIIKDDYPLVEMYPPLGAIGSGEEKYEQLPNIQPRWWFVSEDGSRVIQAQHDTIAVNWRNRSHADLAPAVGYPGFNSMASDAKKMLDLWKANSDVRELNRPVCSLFYDNLWPMEDGVSTASVFRFWNHLGVSGRFLGPEMNWTIILENDRLTGPANLSLTAEIGAMARGDETVRVARVRLNAIAHSADEEHMWVALDVLHEQILHFLDLIVTDEVRLKWQA